MLPLLRKLIVVSTCCILSIALPATPEAGAVTTTQPQSGTTVAHLKLNGLFAQTFLIDGNNLGGLVASKDQIANTSGLDFSYAYPDPTDTDQFILIEAAGEIPNSAFTITSTTAHLVVTVTNSTSYLLIRCVINQVTGSFHCTPHPTPMSFDLTWVNNGFGTTTEKTTRVETLGPVTTKLKGEFTIKTANINGIWDGHHNTNASGTLQDTQSTTITREIMVQPNP